jgi:hypothetical protein
MKQAEQIITVEFVGPFSWLHGNGVPSISETDAGRNKGVYLWTVQLDQGELVYYVGQTGREFAERMLEHFREHMSGGYHLWDPKEFRRGRKVLLWPGRHGRDGERSLSVFIEHFPGLASAVVDLARTYRFFIAPLECDKRLRQRIEAAVAQYLYKSPGMVGEFQIAGLVYRPRLDDEVAVQALIRCKETLIGIPDTLWV